MPSENIGTFYDFPTFWTRVNEEIAKTGSGSCIIRCNIESGCFSNGFTGWCRAWCSAQNLISFTYGVTGSIVLVDGSDNVYYARITGGAGNANTLVDTWQEFITSFDIANNFTTTSAGYVADARCATILDSRIQQTEWATSHTITLTPGKYYLFVGLDCMYSAYCSSSGSVVVNQIYKNSSSKVTYTTGSKTITFKTSDGGTCCFMIVRHN